MAGWRCKLLSKHSYRILTYGKGSTGGVPPLPDWMADLAHRAGETPNSADAKEKMDRDSNWIGEWADDLTVAIALKEWEQAVKLVEEGTITPCCYL